MAWTVRLDTPPEALPQIAPAVGHRLAGRPDEALKHLDSLSEASRWPARLWVGVERARQLELRGLTELGEGELFGEMSLVETELTSASVRAVGKTECLVLPKFAIEQIMKHDRDFSLKIYQAFCKILSERLRRTTQDLFEARKGR